MALDFIFMLTRNDRTVKDAMVHLQTALAAGVHHIGFKDIGLPVEDLKELNQTIQAAGATSYLEVVSLGVESEVVSAKSAVEIGVDFLLGGTHVEAVLPTLAGSGIQYYPFPGRVVGHPSVLEGTVEDIVISAKYMANLEGVHGLDLLAYRAKGDVEALMAAVCSAVDKPVIIAGSIETPERIQALQDAGAAGFTIGTAALDGKFFAGDQDLGSQLSAIQVALAKMENCISPYGKVNLEQEFSKFTDHWSPKVAGRINNMQVKIAKFSGSFTWHYHDDEDELFLVNKGLLLMKFRDREEVIEKGEFIIVPRGVEHCPVALTDECEIILLEPATTLNTGNVENDFTISELENVS
ncbi:cupin domain-containing protein [Kiloniella antarctica]|uniref:Cupin domain-containing protein n=1 Tax=Kiloniella antarctica TaxID=1550907 RepID=A0ABW5BJ30_9PROT